MCEINPLVPSELGGPVVALMFLVSLACEDFETNRAQ